MSSGRPMIRRAPIVAERVRRIGGQSFAFLPHRFLRDGFFASLRPDELRLYFFLLLAADREGVSYYHYDSICSVLEVPLETYLEARNGLIAKDLIAFDGTRFQVLSLPAWPLTAATHALESSDDFENNDGATTRHLLQSTLGSRKPGR
jgi:hypothetical protein